MLYFKCKYWDRCGGDSCERCPERKRYILEDLKDLGAVQDAGSTNNELYIACIQARKEMKRR